MNVKDKFLSFFILTGWLTFVIAEKSPVLFFSSYINSNSLNYYGMLIDSSGNICDYQFFASNWPSGGLDFSSFLDTMLAVSTSTGKRVSIDTLSEMEALVKPASEGVVSDYGGCCCDLGRYRYSAVMYNSTKDSLWEVICFQSLERNIFNSSASARTIASWLNSIDSVEYLTYTGMVKGFRVTDSTRLSEIAECAAPDSMLYSSVAVLPLQPVTVAKQYRFSPSSEVFNLIGQKGQKCARQLMVGEKGKMPVNLKQESRSLKRIR